MIVSERFKGDAIDFQWAQHDQYGKAIGIILEGCRKHYLHHLEQFKDESENETMLALKNISSLDHRVLQSFHDHLAAYWRKRYLRSNKPHQGSTIEWLLWLEREVNNFREKSQVYIGICLLAMNKCESSQETRLLKYLQNFAKRMYPLTWHDYLARVSMEETLYTLHAILISIFVILSLYSSIISPTTPITALILGSIFFILYVYACNKKLHSLCMENIFRFLIRLLLIWICSIFVAFLISGVVDLQVDLLFSHKIELTALSLLIISLNLIKQLCTKKW